MQKIKLYRLLLLSVLTLAGCGGEEPANPPAAAPPSAEATPPPEARRTLLFLGNSLSAGFGVAPEQAFPALLQARIDSLGWDFEVMNAGESGLTTAGGLSRIDWLLRKKIDVLVLELGGNDGLRGVPPEVTQANLQGIIDRTREKFPDAHVVLAGMLAPPNMGAVYTSAFAAIYPAIEAANERVTRIPFLLERVGGIPSLNQPDGIHPTAEGHVLVAETVWTTLRPVLESLRR